MSGSQQAFRPYDVCPHGKVRGWEGAAEPGERLPEIEWCSICDPDSRPVPDWRWCDECRGEVHDGD